MSRMIDGDALLENYGLKDAVKYGGKDRHGYDTLMLYEIRDMIEDAPTIDPVKHGRWELRHIYGEDPCGCSECGNSVNVHGYQYCPSCGAKMDGDAE